MANKRVVVTGLGSITPVGKNVSEYWESLKAGNSGAGPITRFDSSEYATRFACEIKDFDPLEHFDRKEVRRLDPFVQYSVVASREAIANSGIDMEKVDRERFGVFVGSGIGGINVLEEQAQVLLEKGPRRVSPFLIPRLIANIAPGQISISLGLKGPNSCVVTACATSTHAVGDAFKIIERGQATLMLAGGTEAAITPLGVAGFSNMNALSRRNDSPETASRPFSQDRDGFVMGEGAGILLLEEYEHAKARGATIYAEIVGYGLTADAYHITAPAPGGEGAARSMKMALEDAGMATEEIDYINAHGTSTPYNDKMETAAIKTVFGDHAQKLMVSSTKSMIGHLLGAAGAVEAVTCVLSIKEGIVTPTINLETRDPECDLDYVPNTMRKAEVGAALSNSLGFGGHNATIIFRRAE